MAYDKHIAPLMTEIIRLAKEYDVPMFATFVYSEPEDDVLLCTTALPLGNDGRHEIVDRLREVVRPRAHFMAMTITQTRRA
jgi:hypothetical protein